MKKFILITVLTLFVSSLNAQVGQARTLIVKMVKWQSSQKGLPKKHRCIIGLRILINITHFKINGPNTNNFIRVRWMESIGELDTNSADSDELKYWNKCSSILHRGYIKNLDKKCKSLPCS